MTGSYWSIEIIYIKEMLLSSKNEDVFLFVSKLTSNHYCIIKDQSSGKIFLSKFNLSDYSFSKLYEFTDEKLTIEEEFFDPKTVSLFETKKYIVALIQKENASEDGQYHGKSYIFLKSDYSIASIFDFSKSNGAFSKCYVVEE